MIAVAGDVQAGRLGQATYGGLLAGLGIATSDGVPDRLLRCKCPTLKDCGDLGPRVPPPFAIAPGERDGILGAGAGMRRRRCWLDRSRSVDMMAVVKTLGARETLVARDGQRTARLFHALADETRLRILEQLADGEQCVCDLTGALEAGQSRLSFHLKALKDAGLVADRRQGRWIYYTLRPEAVDELRDVVATIGAPRGRGLRIAPRCCE
jgi:ArsR family transcriptional regulator, arsenate/arsenite/antimonite-responsive transcriptional repressor